MAKQYILAIDQGTSSTKSLIFDEDGKAVAKGVEPLHTNYLEDGFVEQDPQAICENVLSSIKKCLQSFADAGYNINDIITCGISNQRETFVIWNREGKPLYNAVVWQCKRSVKVCDALKQQGLSETVRQKTGLIIDPYFSATKLIWLFQNDSEIKKAVESGEAYFGTIDTWLLYRFTNGEVYATDHTNASRTLLFNIHTLDWDKELIKALGLSGIRLPEIKPSAAHFGSSTFNKIFEKPLPIAAMIGDSHAAAFGEGCFATGSAKATLGTGCSILMNIGNKPASSNNGMVTTINWSIDGRVDYALEGVIVTCGATIEWLKNELCLFNDTRQTEAMATSVEDNNGVYLIPAFSGLGAPHWDMNRKASVSGLTFSANKNHIVRAALESIPYQIKDVIVAMEKDTGVALKELRIHGGLSANAFVTQFIADLLNRPVHCSSMPDISALGAAYLAGLQQKIYKDLDHLAGLNEEKKILQPSGDDKVKKWYEGWQEVIRKE